MLESCDQWMSCINGKIKIIKDSEMENIKSNIIHMAQKSLRTICIGYKELGNSQNL